MPQQLICPGQRFQMRNGSRKEDVVLLFQFIQINFFRSSHALAEQFLQERLSAHSDTAMNLPLRNYDTRTLQRVCPGGYMLINAVDQGPVQVKQQSGQIGTAAGASSVASA